MIKALRTVCDIVHVPLLSFVVEHSHRDDQDESDASDHRPGYDPGQVVWEITDMIEETRGFSKSVSSHVSWQQTPTSQAKYTMTQSVILFKTFQ